MPGPYTAQVSTCHGLAAALHGLTDTYFQLAAALFLLPALKLPRAAFCSLPRAALLLPSVACVELPFGCLLQAGPSTPPCTEASPEVPHTYAQLPQGQAQDHILLLLLLVRLKVAPKAVATWQVPWLSAPQGGIRPWPLGRAGVKGGIWLQVSM